MPLDRVSQYGTDTMSRGAANFQGLTIPNLSADVHSSYGAERDQADSESHPATAGNPLLFVFILLGLIVAMWFVHKSSAVIKGESFGVNWFSFIEVGVMASFFILLIKAVFGRYHVAGITNAVATL